jgi:hypothetical protein
MDEKRSSRKRNREKPWNGWRAGGENERQRDYSSDE